MTRWVDMRSGEVRGIQSESKDGQGKVSRAKVG